MHRIILFLLISISAQAQIPFSISPNNAEGFGSASDIFFNADAVLFNNADSTITFEWERTFVEMPSGWETSVCTNFTCLAPTLAFGEFTIESGYSMDLNCTFFPNNVAGDGEVKLKVWIKNDTTQIITQTYFGFADAVSTIESEIEQSINIFPNPTQGSFKLSSDLDFKEIEIYTSKGELVQKLGKQTIYDIQYLPTNLYFINVLSEQNEVLAILKLNKL